MSQDFAKFEEEHNTKTFIDKKYDEINKKLAAKPYQYFVGKSIKVTFEEYSIENGGMMKECMWVDVKSFNKEKNCLVGTLDNEPLYVKKYKLGDKIFIEKDKIQLVQDKHLTHAFRITHQHLLKEKKVDEFMKKYNDFIIKYNENLD